MKYLDKIAIVALILFVTGCASTSDLEHVQSQVSELSTKVDLLAVDVSSAKSSAESALAKSSAAETAAVNAEKACKDINSKLDRLFKKTNFK